MQDLELLQRCFAGDKLACDEFLRLYSRLIYNYILHVIRSKSRYFDQELPQDIFQELFSTLFSDNCRKLKTFKSKNKSTLATWLRQVTINFTIDYLRRQKPYISLDAEDSDGKSLGAILSDGKERVDSAIGREEKLIQLEDCIERLDLDEKFFVELHFKLGLRLEAIKGMLDLTRGAVDMQKQRLIKKLRECFKLNGYELDF